MKSKPNKATLMTIGYEGRSLENYLDLLIEAGATLLCDVRRNPISRKRGFSKGGLSKSCEGVGIQYHHMPELGIASEQRKNLDSQADYDRLFKKYEKHNLPKQGQALARIHDWVQSGSKVALTCFEREPHRCHRHCVSEALARKFGPSLAPVHL